MIKNELLAAIQLAIWGEGQASIDQHVFDEMKQHVVAALLTPYLSTADMSSELKEKWKRYSVQQIAYNTNNTYEQSQLALTVPYVILKGTAASQYYPHPEYRTLGDIDIMTGREDFDKAYQQLLESGFQIIQKAEREISFQKNGIIIELHRFFASLNSPEQSKYLDDLIIQNITPTHILPDMINGLVLLEHISQHMEHGLGLRQIIDWMMFVNKCLPDEKWPEFEEKANNIGLKTLAIVTTRMCELYLGLPGRNWCEEADIQTCEQLMEYIMACGNFGNKWTSDSDVGQNVFMYIRKPIAAIKWFQERGLANWNAAKRYPILRPFAWFYQGCRYIVKGFEQEGSTSAIRAEYASARKRMNLFDSLGVKQKSKGLVVYRNGKYVKK